MARRAIGYYNTLNPNRSPGETSVYQEFGRRLQARMFALGWNQSDLSRHATMHLPKAAKGQKQGRAIGRDSISGYIRGLSLPRGAALEAIAKALGCAPEDLMPSGGVPSIENDRPPQKSEDDFTAKPIGKQRVHVRLNRVVSEKTFTTIMALLNKEDHL